MVVSTNRLSEHVGLVALSGLGSLVLAWVTFLLGIAAPVRRRRSWLAATAGALVAVVPVGLGAHWLMLPSGDSGLPTTAVAWTAPLDRPANTVTLAVWQQGETVVRVRPDGLYAHRAADGGQVWTLPMRDHERHSGGRDRGDRAVAAVSRGQVVSGRIAVAADQVLVSYGDRLQSLRVRDGGEQWQTPFAKSCTTDRLAAAGTRAVLVEYCSVQHPQGKAALLQYDLTSGQLSSRTELPTETFLGQAAVLSVQPLVLRLAESLRSGVNGVLSFTDDGRLRATVPFTSPEYDLDLDAQAFGAAPVRPVVVTEDQLVTRVKRVGGGAAIVSFSLADGSRRWLTDADRDVYALAAGQGAVVALTAYGHSFHDQLLRLDPRTGEVRSRTLASEARSGGTAWLGEAPNRYVIANELGGTDPYRPLIGLLR